MSHVHPVRVAPGRYEVQFELAERGSPMAAQIARRGGMCNYYVAPLTGTQLLHRRPRHRRRARSPPRWHRQAAEHHPGEVRGRPDLQPWLGMVGHMMVVGPLPDGPEVGKHALTAPVWSHAHAMVPPAPGAAGGQPDESVARYGPEIDFTYSFALPGRYEVRCRPNATTPSSPPPTKSR